MESYVEVAFIQALLVNLSAILIAMYVSVKGQSLKTCVLYAGVIALIGCFCIYPWTVWLMVVIEGLFALVCFRYQLSAYLVSLAMRILFNVSCLKLAKGTFYNFTWFPPLDYRPFACWLLLLFIVAVLIIKWGHVLNQLHFLYEVEIGNSTFKGYLDSGNNCVINGYPVMFVHRNVYEKIGGDVQIKGLMSTMSSEVEGKGKLAAVRVGKGKQIHVLAVQEERYFPMYSDCLLNLRQISEVDKHELI